MAMPRNTATWSSTAADSLLPSSSTVPMTIASREPRYPTPTPMPPIRPRFSSVLTSGSSES